MLRIIFKKRLDLIVATLLPVSILTIGFLVSRAIAHQDETFVPDACGASYGTWFGKETPNSDSYCPGGNVSSTSETAYFDPIDANTIHWHRDQYWTFGVTTPWGTNTCNVSKNVHIAAADFSDSTDYNIGFWNGTETKTRNGNKVDVFSDVTRWFRKVVNGTNYRCPKYRIYETSPSHFDCVAWQRNYGGLQIYDRYNVPANAMTYPGNAIQSTPAESGTVYNCVAF